MLRRLAAAAVGVSLVLLPATVAAHTTTDVVAVAVGDEATVRLQPTHGCGDSPTVEVRIRAPFEGAVAGEVDGWSATAEGDGAGNTVLAWTGGVLPADQTGSFPIEFVVPGTPGDLLLFPAIQRCESGDELAWISGDPLAEYPAPRLLVLRPGEPPAATIDDVAPDAPGRDQLVAIVDVDAPTTTTVPPATSPAPVTTAPPATEPTTPAATVPASSAPIATAPSAGTLVEEVTGTVGPATEPEESDSESGSPLLVVALVAAAVVAVAGAAVVVRRRAASAGSDGPSSPPPAS